jgi:hypothetical protein
MANARRKPNLDDTSRWKRLRRHQLALQPFCVMCLADGYSVVATVVDHIVPHHGDKILFFHGELQSLCATHHNSFKKKLEQRGYSTQIGIDGWPVDQRHPLYRKRSSRNRKVIPQSNQ